MARAFAAAFRCLFSVFLSLVLLVDSATALPLVAQMSRMPFPAPSYAPLVCRVADTDTVVSVSNGSADTVTVIAIDANEEQQELAVLEAGQSLDVIAPAGTLSLGFAQNDDWLGDVYPVAGVPGEAVTVPYTQQAQAPPAAEDTSPLAKIRAQQAGPGSVELQFSNTTAGLVAAVVIDETDKAYALFGVKAGETVPQRVQPGTTFWFYDVATNTPVGGSYTVNGADGDAVTIPLTAAAADPVLSQLQLQQGAGSIEAEFVNTTADDVDVTVVVEGAAYPIFGIAAGQTVRQRVLPGAELWFYADKGAKVVNGPYAVTGLEGEVVTIEARPAAPALSDAQRRQRGEGSIEAEFVNTTGDTVTVTVTEGQDALPLFDVAAGASVKQRVLPGAELWFYADKGTRIVNGPHVVAGLEGEVVTIEARAAAPALSEMQQRQQGEGSIEAEFVNTTENDVVAAVVDEAKTAHPLFAVAAGQSGKHRVLPQASLYFYKKDGGELVSGPYVVTGLEGEVISIEAPKQATPDPAIARIMRVQTGKGSVELTFSNTLEVDVVAALLDDDKTVPLVRVPAGQSVSQRARPGTELWFYRTDTSEALRYPYKVAAAPETVSVPFDPRAAVVAEQSGPGSSMVLFANFLPFPVTVQVNRPDGSRVDMMDLEQGAKGVQGHGIPGTVLSFVRAGTDKRVSDDYTVLDGFYGVDLPINATQAEQAGPGSVKVRLMNDSGSPLDVVTADKEGKRAFLFALEPGEGAGNMSRHANFLPGSTIWFLKQFTDEPVGEAFVVPQADGAAVNIPYRPNEAAVAQMGAGSVEITFANYSEQVAAVTVVNESEQHVTLVKIPAGHSITTRALPKSVLWFYKGDTEEKLGQDMPYFVSDVSGQKVDLPWNPSDEQILAMTNISIDKIIADFTAGQAAQSALGDGPSLCWKDSYGRGVGTVPRNCEPGFSEDTAGLCWPNARPGYVCDFFVCRQAACPAGFRDDGLTCFKPEPYKRDEYPVNAGEAAKAVGDGLAWFFSFGTYEASGDTGLDGARRRCSEAHGDNCVTANGDTIVYETCKAGYEQAPVITNLCTPSCPSPMTDGGIFCAKHTYTREASLMSCDAGAVYDAGLCYEGCRSGFAGVGPVCWNACPAKLPYNCGASCAVDKAACDGAIVDQVLSPVLAVGSIALAIVTGGGSTGATAGAKAGGAAGKTAATLAAKMAAKEAAKAGLKAAVKKALSTVVKTAAKELVVDAAIGTALSTVVWGGTKIATQVKTRNALKEMVQKRIVGTVSDERIDAVVDTMMAGAEAQNPASEFPWSSLDPTGVADIVMAYNHPICSDVK